MRIVDRKTFLDMPEGTVFMKCQQWVFEELCIKGETTSYGDFYLWNIGPWFEDAGGSFEWCDVLSAALESGEETGPMQFDGQMRDGCPDKDQLFAVWSKEDVKGLIARLSLTL